MKDLIAKSGLIVLLLTVMLRVQALSEDRIFFVYDASNGLADNSAQIVMCTKTGRIVVLTIGHINFFDGQSFMHVDRTHADNYRIPEYKGRYQVYFDRFHHLWMKNDQMMACVDLLKEKFVSDVPKVLHELGMTQRVDDILGDGESNIWFRSGQTLYSPPLKKQVPISHPSPVHNVDLYKDSLLLMFHADGVVSVYDYKTCKLLHKDSAFQGEDTLRYTQGSELCLIGNRYYQLLRGDKASVLLRYDVDSRQWTKLLERPFLMNSLCQRDQLIYIGSERGYLVYDYATGNVDHVETLKLSKDRTRQQPDIGSLCFDRQGGMWIGTNKRGLLYAKPYESPIHVYTMDAPEARQSLAKMDRLLKDSPGDSLPRLVNCVYKDSRGWTWTGTYTGLVLEKTPGGDKRYLNRRDGLGNEVVRSVVEDDEHHIWVGTSYGLSRLFIENGEVGNIVTYINFDNVPSESFLNGRAVNLGDGNIAMQTLDHMVVFRPSSFHTNVAADMVLYPKLTRIYVNGMEMGPDEELDGRVIMDRVASRMREMSVNYNQNSLLLVFSGLNYFRPIQTFYRVRIKGVYDEWQVLSYGDSNGRVDKNGMLRLSLSGLHPGTYNVELQASMSPDVWPQEPFVWVINVEEPWWRRTGIYLTLGILILSVLVANVFYFNKSTRLRMQLNNEEVDLLRNVRSFCVRCERLSGSVLAPPAVKGDEGMKEKDQMSGEFVEAMLRIVPFVNSHKGESLRMSQLSKLAGLHTAELYRLLSAYLDKNPRQIILKLRLEEGARLLRETKLSVEEIADRCRFATPNYFIAAFYHLYRMTPLDYRKSRSL